MPVAGIAVKDNIVLGISLLYEHGESKGGVNPIISGGSYGAGAFMRRYLPLSKSFYLLGQTGLNYLHSEFDLFSNSPNINQSIRSWALSANVFPGISYAVNKKFHLEIAINDLLKDRIL
jgi:hypothetical protein